MPGDDELRSRADPTLEQYFLVSPEKLALLIDAAGIQPEDDVVEVGAGAGTVARNFPPCTSLTVIELDEQLIETLRKNVPTAQVIHGDALQEVQGKKIDVLVSNLPNNVTEELIDMLPELSFRTAVMTVGQSSDLSRLPGNFTVQEITEISGHDFIPPQPSVSRVVRISREQPR